MNPLGVRVWSVVCLVATITVGVTEGFYLPGTASVTYSKGEQTPLVYVNRLDSKKNVLPYDYYYFDYCPAEDGKKNAIHENIGQILFGERFKPSAMNLAFKKEVACQMVCSRSYDSGREEDKKKLRRFVVRIKQEYEHHWIVDNLPVVFAQNKDQKYLSTRMGGVHIEGKKENYYLFNHFDFTVEYHQDDKNPEQGRIISVTAVPRTIDHGSDDPVKACKAVTDAAKSGKQLPAQFLKLKGKFSVAHTYSVTWKTSATMWVSRWDNYLQINVPSFHWFSIINSVIITVFLSGMVAMILLRALHKDISRYNSTDLSEDDAMEEFGWKLVHGDVFRSPPYAMLLSVSLGVGTQFMLMGFVSISFACLGILSPANRGSLATAGLVLFVCLGTPAGYISSRSYKMMGGEMWKSNVLLTAFLYPGVIFGIFFILNAVLWSQQSSGAVPFTTMIAVVALWFCVSVPLIFLGAYMGFKKPAIEHPVRTNQIPRQIPEQLMYMKPFPSAMIGGILPFGAIFIELMFILTSVWYHQLYYLFGFLFIVSIILAVTCAEVSVLLCYFHLCAEDYNWWWQGFFSSASTAAYLFLYSIFYYYKQLDMHGFLNMALYFGYTSIFTLIFGLVTGTIGFFSCLLFVRTIYSYVKVD
eukprot:Nk52_evm41s2531 gene=Nk52_evmTU41s2531